MRPSGHVILWIGFLSAAYWSVHHLENSDDKWSTIPWTLYGASMAVGIVGIVLLRLADRRVHADHRQTDAEFSVVQRTLTALAGTVHQLSSNRQQSPSEVLRRIDLECVPKFAEFADARQALTKRFGLQEYADVMTEFAAAERYVNRSWSAAVDGYVDEVAASLDKADRHLQNAQQLLIAAESDTSSG
jgi:hypothetical protein